MKIKYSRIQCTVYGIFEIYFEEKVTTVFFSRPIAGPIQTQPITIIQAFISTNVQKAHS